MTPRRTAFFDGAWGDEAEEECHEGPGTGEVAQRRPARVLGRTALSRPRPGPCPPFGGPPPSAAVRRGPPSLAALATATLLPYAADVADALGPGLASALPPAARAAFLAALAAAGDVQTGALCAFLSGGGVGALALAGPALTRQGVQTALAEGAGQSVRALSLAGPLAADAALLAALPSLVPHLTRLDCGGTPASDAAAALVLPRLVRLRKCTPTTAPAASWEEEEEAPHQQPSSLPALRLLVWPPPPVPPPAARAAPPGSRQRVAVDELVEARDRRDRALAALRAARPGLVVVEAAPGGVDAGAWAWAGVDAPAATTTAAAQAPPLPPPPPPPPLAARFAAAYADRAARLATVRAAASAKAARRAAARATGGERAILAALEE